MAGSFLSDLFRPVSSFEKMGTSQAAIARLESGTRLPTVDTLFRLARVLDLDFTITPNEPLVVRPHRAA